MLFGLIKKKAPVEEPVIITQGHESANVGGIIPVPDFNSQTWAYVVKWAQDSLDDLRRKNDSSSNTAEQTADIRGRIKAMKQVIGLPDNMQRKKGILNIE